MVKTWTLLCSTYMYIYLITFSTMDDLSIGFDDWLLADDEELVWDANNASASKPTVEAPEAGDRDDQCGP